MSDKPRYFPQLPKHPEVERELRIAFDHLYTLRDQLTEQADKITQAQQSGHDAQSAVQSQVLFTKINGLAVKSTVPTNGQVLKFNAASGQIEWT